MSCRHLKTVNHQEICTCAPGQDPLVPSPVEKERFCHSSQYNTCPLYRAYSPSKPVKRFVCGYFSSNAERA